MPRSRDGFSDMDWDKLKVFHAAAEAGSFTHAGEQLGLSQSAVSRQVSALEQELSVALETASPALLPGLSLPAATRFVVTRALLGVLRGAVLEDAAPEPEVLEREVLEMVRRCSGAAPVR